MSKSQTFSMVIFSQSKESNGQIILPFVVERKVLGLKFISLRVFSIFENKLLRYLRSFVSFFFFYFLENITKNVI